MAASDTLLVAAIDFGTTYSGYAFSFRHDYQSEPTKISTNLSWQCGGGGVRRERKIIILVTTEKGYVDNKI